MSNNNSNSSGIGFLGLLFIVFLVLKLCKIIDWSWWWVLCPLWGPVAVFLLVLGILYLFAAIKVCFFSTPDQKQQMKRIIDDQKASAGKSKWQQRMEEMQEAQKLREKQ